MRPVSDIFAAEADNFENTMTSSRFNFEFVGKVVVDFDEMRPVSYILQSTHFAVLS